MKKLTTLMLGLSLVLGTTALFGEDAAPTEPTKKTVKKHHKKAAKKTSEEKKATEEKK